MQRWQPRIESSEQAVVEVLEELERGIVPVEEPSLWGDLLETLEYHGIYI